MRNLLALLLIINVLLFAGCSEEKANHDAVSSQPAQANLKQPADARSPSTTEPKKTPTPSGVGAQDISLSDPALAQAAGMAAERKIIRNSELTVETESPTDGQQRITAIAESLGGFVATSEFKQNTTQSKPTQTVTVVVRVPSLQFSAALNQIQNIGGKVIQEKDSGQDVSEEYVDLEARIRAKKALEAQFLEIMKQAKKVSDALEVQNELADVRTEIERLEGRRRFLENQSALSTITINLQLPAPVVATTSIGFGEDIKQAFGAAIDIAAAIILFLIRAVIMLLPIVLIFGVPAWLFWRFMRRRLQEKPAAIIEP